ncbi:MAG: TIGR03790 family protein [Bacteroidota bacterium]|nr:TIGR03790 family protein [Bacteroidota bacterium]
MKNIILITSLVVITTSQLCFGQTPQQVDYSDVLVIINDNSPISDSVGIYFSLARNIPPENIVRINAPVTEEIDSTTFTNVRSQIETHILNHMLREQINYIVTTKGVPLKINRGNTFSTSSPSSSLESELTLILSSMASSIGQNGYIVSPYFLGAKNFSKSIYDMYLVTRLDGYTFNDIKTLIDKSGSPAYIDTTVRFVFDQDPNWNGSLPYLNNSMSYAASKISAKGLIPNLDQTNTYLTYQSNVIGYASWGSNDYNANQYTQYARPKNTWADGAIAETYVSTSARTFSTPVTYGQSVVADLISEGVTGVKGYVYEPYSNAMAIVWVLFDRYTDGYNLAESYYMSSRALSWMDVIIGDPKMQVLLKNTLPTPDLPIQIGSFVANYMYANDVQIEWTTISEINNYGFNVQRYNENSMVFETLGFIPGKGTTTEPQTYTYLDENVSTISLQYRLEQIDNDGLTHYFGPINLSPNTIKESIALQKTFMLYPNYPNPFNPTTEIKFTLENKAKVTLMVYNSIGQEVDELINGEINEGTHSIKFDGSNLASGIYYSVMQSTNGILIQKMILIK